MLIRETLGFLGGVLLVGLSAWSWAVDDDKDTRSALRANVYAIFGGVRWTELALLLVANLVSFTVGLMSGRL